MGTEGGGADPILRAAGHGDAARAHPLRAVEADSVDGAVERVPIGPGVLERFPGLNALPGHIEVEHEAGEVAVRKIREQRMPEWIILKEQD
jgi:hypothetical protein